MIGLLRSWAGFRLVVVVWRLVGRSVRYRDICSLAGRRKEWTMVWDASPGVTSRRGESLASRSPSPSWHGIGAASHGMAWHGCLSQLEAKLNAGTNPPYGGLINLVFSCIFLLQAYTRAGSCWHKTSGASTIGNWHTGFMYRAMNDSDFQYLA